MTAVNEEGAPLLTSAGEEAHVIAESEEAHNIITSREKAQINAGFKEEANKIISDAALPSQAVEDLLSIGVCTRCIFRLFGIHKQSYSCSLLSPSICCSLLEKPKSSDDHVVEKNGFKACGDSEICCICLGVLQFRFTGEQEILVKREEHSNDVIESIVKLLKKDGHEIDGFSLEVSIPPIILANERAVWLYMKRKYESELWFKEKFLAGQISVKDALKLSITNSLETLLAAKSGISTFRIRLTYTHDKASLKLENFLEKDNGCKRRKTGTEDGESDAVINISLNRLQDHVFCERFKSPPEKLSEPCHLQFLCFRTPIYIGGRYLKYSRNVSQTRWVIDDERMGEASVEEIIGNQILPICQGDNYKFHAAGREDIDVRMLGSGRPFLVEVHNARHVPSQLLIEEMEEKINNLEARLVSVRNLKVLGSGSEGWTLMREGEAEKQKQYAALVWISRPLEDEDVKTLTSLKDMCISQRTPIRVLHRRSPLDREKIIHWMKIEPIVGSTQYFLLHLCTQAGTYIKEFVHGDLGRTHPNLGSILGCRAEIMQLDVTDVKMDCFN